MFFSIFFIFNYDMHQTFISTLPLQLMRFFLNIYRTKEIPQVNYLSLSLSLRVSLMAQTTPNHTQTVSGWAAHDSSGKITPYIFKRRYK